MKNTRVHSNTEHQLIFLLHKIQIQLRNSLVYTLIALYDFREFPTNGYSDNSFFRKKF